MLFTRFSHSCYTSPASTARITTSLPSPGSPPLLSGCLARTHRMSPRRRGSVGRKLRRKRSAPAPTHAVAAYPQQVLSAPWTRRVTLHPPSCEVRAGMCPPHLSDCGFNLNFEICRVKSEITPPGPALCPHTSNQEPKPQNLQI